MNNVLKKTIINFKTRSNIKNRSLQQNVNFEQSRKIAIFYSDKFDDKAAIEKLIEQLRLEGKEVHILVFCHQPKSIKTDQLHLTPKNISTYGQIKKEEVSAFLQENYDFAICFDESNHYTINYIFSLFRAKCRIGIMQPDRKNLFEMIVIADKKETDLCNEVLKYLKMIKTYEY